MNAKALRQLGPYTPRILWGVILGCTITGALICSELVRAFTRPHAPKGTPPS